MRKCITCGTTFGSNHCIVSVHFQDICICNTLLQMPGDGIFFFSFLFFSKADDSVEFTADLYVTLKFQT